MTLDRRRTVGCHVSGVGFRGPPFTTNPDDFDGLTSLLTVVPVTRPSVPPDGR